MRCSRESARARAVLVLIAAQASWAVQADTQSPQTPWALNLNALYPLLVLLAVIAFTAVLLRYMWGLRNQISGTIINPQVDDNVRTNVLSGYSDWPLGLPRGTVRALLALVVVFGSVALLAISMAVPQTYKFPDALVGILGAILGFYFGKNGASTDGQAIAAVAAANADARDAKSESQDAQAQTAVANQALQDTRMKHDTLASDRLDDISGDLQDAVDIGQGLAKVLPGKFGQSIATATQVVSNTLTTVSDLRKGDLSGAVQQASQIVAGVAPNLPVVNVLAQAIQAIGPVLGGSIPPLALLTTIVSIGSKLGSVAYAHWVARIMDMPYTPEQFSPKLFDSNAAISVITQVPTVFKAFRPQLAAGDREAALDVVHLALAGDGGEALVKKYPQAFAGLAQPSVESAVRDLQKAALDFILGNEVPPDAAKNVGGLSQLLRAVDKVRGNPDASAALDLVMTTAKTLEGAQKHPETELNNAAALLSRSNRVAAA
jgi:uncharacterized membrane protein